MIRHAAVIAVIAQFGPKGWRAPLPLLRDALEVPCVASMDSAALVRAFEWCGPQYAN